ncbi:MAG TPA: RluA family pseudouridine synthase [Chlamydiales bacterium]|nr:RluA family pseudouridine synthase [Chlamydiales bacterium]
MRARKYTIPKPMTLREALAFLYPDSSRRTLQNWLKAGRFSINGKLAKWEDALLETGQILASKDSCRAPKVPGLKILYEDRYLIAIEKPAGLLSVPLDEEGNRSNALSRLQEGLQTPSIFAVHRIDRDVSGVLIFARGKESEERLKALFEKHNLHRQYFAIVEGRMKKESGTWKNRLAELSNYDVVPSPDGRDATTHFKVLRRSAKYTYLQVLLETGRKHQIRVHCQMAGHPVVGDIRYGAIENPIRRICLHAVHLELRHPFTGRHLAFNSSLPSSFKILGAF